MAARRTKALGVTIEAQYTVGEYDILILSAQQSTGLETWLRENGYRIPPGASEVIASYLRQNMRFFVAKVNLSEHAKLGFTYLRPLQVAYESPKFMLPIRLGMVNAKGSQDLFVFALTRKGRVETTNYRAVKLPVDMELPVFLKQPNEFGAFYKAMFTRQVESQNGHAVFTEYAWDMRWCDPCAADPLSSDELRQLGVFWADRGERVPSDVFLTRLHVRYDSAHFPEDLVFQETADRANFQGRYVLRHAWTGADACREAGAYRQSVVERHSKEAEQLARLTGWSIDDIRKKMGPEAAARPRGMVGNHLEEVILSRRGLLLSLLFAERGVDLLLDVTEILAERFFLLLGEEAEGHAHDTLRELDVQPVLAELRAARDVEVELAEARARVADVGLIPWHRARPEI